MSNHSQSANSTKEPFVLIYSEDPDQPVFDMTVQSETMLDEQITNNQGSSAPSTSDAAGISRPTFDPEYDMVVSPSVSPTTDLPSCTDSHGLRNRRFRSYQLLIMNLVKYHCRTVNLLYRSTVVSSFYHPTPSIDIVKYFKWILRKIHKLNRNLPKQMAKRNRLLCNFGGFLARHDFNLLHLTRALSRITRITMSWINSTLNAAQRAYELFQLFGDRVFQFPFVFNRSLMELMDQVEFSAALDLLKKYELALLYLFREQFNKQLSIFFYFENMIRKEHYQKKQSDSIKREQSTNEKEIKLFGDGLFMIREDYLSRVPESN
ncbi:hypothetical protein BD560DRAFT_463860 [Blakeslea trispora]|nr:hypothetical protein BD560DRAFT_463860 [Blakeslea trispora]